MRSRTASRGRSETGNVMLFFLLLVFVVLGALSYSLYIGRIVQEKIKIDAAADAAALSMANHVASGLNMIAVNNLAIAANLHTAAAVPFIGRYYAVARAMMVGVSDTKGVVQTLASVKAADDSPFGAGFKATKDFTGLLTKAAAGNARLNRILAGTWFLQTPAHAVRIARLNLPGALPIPAKLLGVAPESRAGAMSVRRLGQSTVEAAYCHAIHASEVLGDRRHSVAFWVRGLLDATGLAAEWLRPVEQLEALVQGIVAFINGFVEPVRDIINHTVAGITGGACKRLPVDFGVSIVTGHFGSFTRKSDERRRVDGLCAALAKLDGAVDAVSKPPIPRFAACGITHAGKFGAQSQAFAAQLKLEATVGFVFPDVRTPADLALFEDSVNHGIVVAKPLFRQDELPLKPDGRATACPAGWSWTTSSGDRRCEGTLDGIAFGAVAAALPNSLLARTQWAVGQAKAEYHPALDDPQAAATYALRRPAQDDEAINRTRVQLFWPAWRGRAAPVTSRAGVLALIGKE